MSSALNGKVDKVDGKGLSTNDYDNTEKGKVADNTTARHTHSNKSVLDSTTASYTTDEKTKLSGIESGAEANIIETVKVNGTALIPSSKAVDVTVPTKVSDLTNDSGYTTNIGTITGITMNSESKGTSGTVDLGTVITAHQDITGKEDKSNKITSMTSSSTDTQYPSAKAVYDELEDLKEENSELKQRIEDEENNQLINTASGTNLNINDTASYPIREIQVKGNSVQDGTPTPTNPVEIETAGDQINYFNKDTILAGHLINSNGTITEDSYNFVSDYIEVDSDREYTISAVTNKAKRIAYYNSEQTFISRPVVSNYSGTVTTPSNAKYVRLSCHNDDLNSLQFYNTIGEIPLTISNSDNTQSQTFTIPCQQPMRSIGNVRDVFVKENGVWYEKHNLGEVILNGTETWYMTNDGNFKRFSISINTLEKFTSRKSNLLSDYYVGNTTSGIGHMFSYDGYVYLYPTSDITSVDLFKTWLSNNNTKIVYVLGTPNYIECTQEQVTALEAIEKARTYKETTNVYSEDITPAYITITYVRDLESAILSYIDASVNQAIGGAY